MAESREGHLYVESSIELPDTFVGTEFKPIVRYQDRYYLQKNWVYETKILENLKRLWDVPMVQRDFSKELEGRALQVEQYEALQKGLNSPLMIISGGPGTGKTYTVSHLVDIFLKGLSDVGSGRVLLASPTGKAASHLQTTLMKLPFSDQIRAGTLHTVLGLPRNKSPHLFEEMIIIDECSMIDVELWSILLSAVGPNSRLILLGDHHQLPPVEGGTLFAELSLYAKEHRKESFVHLTKSMRSDQMEILSLADAVNQKDMAKTFSTLKKIATLNFHHLSKRFPQPSLIEPNPEELFEGLSDYRILSTLREGPLGVKEINRKIYERLRATFAENMWWPIPIMITKNDHRLGRSNGEVGLLVRHYDEKLAQAYFRNKEGEIEKLPAVLLPPYDLAYTISVHKSQGSEYTDLLLVVPPGSEKFGKEILYTGITRAKKSLRVYASDETLRACLSKDSLRRSSLSQRLRTRV